MDTDDPSGVLDALSRTPAGAAALKLRDEAVKKDRQALIAERSKIEAECEERLPEAAAARDQAAADLDPARRALIDRIAPARAAGRSPNHELLYFGGSLAGEDFTNALEEA
jgi:hypothetical protein